MTPRYPDGHAGRLCIRVNEAGAYRNIGVSGGDGLLIFTGAEVDTAWERYFEPDVILLTGPGERLRAEKERRGAANELHSAAGLDGRARDPFPEHGTLPR